MCSIKLLCCRWPWVVTPLSTLNHLSFYILHRLMHLRNWRSQRLQIWCKVWMCKSQRTDDKLSLIGAWSGHVTHYTILGAPVNHITGTAEPKVVKFCTRVGYIILTTEWHITNERAWLWSQFCRLSWCSASRGFVSDSWATCPFLCSVVN